MNRILLYGRSDGRRGNGIMTDEIQRRVIHVADAVVAGQGNGPLAPILSNLGLILGANNAAAMDWVGAHLLAYDPEKIALVRHAFDQFRWPIADFPNSSVSVAGDLGEGSPLRVLETIRQPVVHPIGWPERLGRRAAGAVRIVRHRVRRSRGRACNIGEPVGRLSCFLARGDRTNTPVVCCRGQRPRL